MFGLTDQQRAAVDHAGGHLLIVAGAGSGKTTTLASRLAALVGGGVAPERILLLTFSRRAAAELLRRAEAEAGHDVARRTWGGTFHGVANRLLRRHGWALGLDPAFTVLDQADTADLLALVRTDLCETADGGRRRAKKDTMAAILSRVVNTATPLSQVLRESFPWCVEDHEELRATFEAYRARKRAAHVLDYDDLLLGWSSLLQSSAAPALRAQFDHVLVDEYQDTNSQQADLLHALGSGGAHITAVGDDAQAIYGFRNATQRNILEFPERFGAHVVVLDRNHRSTPAILRTTNAVMAEAAAEHKHDKALWSTRSDGPAPALVSCADEGAQSAAVCGRIVEQHERGVALHDQAVLFRAAHHSDLLELELAARRIPFVKFGGLRFLEAAHVKDLLCVLRIVENPSTSWRGSASCSSSTASVQRRRAGSHRPARLCPQTTYPKLVTPCCSHSATQGASIARPDPAPSSNGCERGSTIGSMLAIATPRRGWRTSKSWPRQRRGRRASSGS